MSEDVTSSEALGIIAGAGAYPLMMLQAAKRDGKRVIGVGFRGAYVPEFADQCDAYACFRIGSLEGPVEFLKQQGVTQAVLTGQIKPSSIYTMWPDATARRLLAQMERRNAHSLFGAVCDYAALHGIRVLPSTTYLEEYMLPEGLVAGPPVSPELMPQAQRGMAFAREIARLDIGQSLIYGDNKVLCVEGFKGTNECIAKAAGLADCPMLCKVSKAGHDMRFDVPCIGIDTVRHCAKAGIAHIFIEAQKTMLLQAEAVQDFCAQQGISIYAMACEQVEELSPPEFDLQAVQGDAQHARVLAQELHRLGIGDCAVVCDGVVITVGDSEGVEKCIRRAATYMKKLRLLRVINWLLGRSKVAPVPIVLASVAPLDKKMRALAQRSHLQIVD